MSVYKFKTDARLREESEQAYLAAEQALEKNHLRIYERNMDAVYEIDEEMKRRKKAAG